MIDDCALPAQVPALKIFESSYSRGKFDASRKLSNGNLLEFSHIYPMDAVYDTPEGVPDDVGPHALLRVLVLTDSTTDFQHITKSTQSAISAWLNFVTLVGHAPVS